MVHDVFTWIRALRYTDIPPAVRREACLCLMDTLGVAAAATTTPLAGIMARFVRVQMPGVSPLLFTQGSASIAGAALYGAALTDALDAHDGHVLAKGHVGAALVPALVALSDLRRVRGHELLTRIVIGYEIGTRAGIALHATAADYHTSGAWNALGVAAVAGRDLGLDQARLAESLGIAEFYGPRSQMMRCIDHPTMVKDGSAWGAHVGVNAAMLAAAGFTGAPAVTVTARDVAPIWADLGSTWLIRRQYRKAYPVCQWAQPAVEAVRSLYGRLEGVSPDEITRIEVVSFHEAGRLAAVEPCTTEQAQYSLPWSVACALIGGDVSVRDVAQAALRDDVRQRLAARVVVSESPVYNARFPQERWAFVRVRLNDGRCLESGPQQARGDRDRPLTEPQLIEKFHALADPVVGRERSAELREAIEALDDDIELSPRLFAASPARSG